jgi:hypothetical protein
MHDPVKLVHSPRLVRSPEGSFLADASLFPTVPSRARKPQRNVTGSYNEPCLPGRE